jgi:addiction module RelE/StbE family toxin
MHLRWSPAAADDLFGIFEYIRQDNPSAAERVAKAIYQSASDLVTFPNRGRTGRVEGTRELPLPSLPFIVIYRVTSTEIEIARIIHGAQRWPPQP